MKKIYTKKNEVILVDDDDFEFLNKFKWHVTSRGYVKKNSYKNGENSLIHRIIMNISDRKILIDHKDRNPLNNQKENLRLATNSENQKK